MKFKPEDVEILHNRVQEAGMDNNNRRISIMIKNKVENIEKFRSIIIPIERNAAA